MSVEIVRKQEQAYGAFNGGDIIENKPIGFDREGGKLKSYSNLFYWAFAEAKVDSTIGLHPHQGFEIMSFVLNGEIRHYDTAGKTWIPLHAGDVQIIRSGSGISHAEFMAEGAQMFQIWFDPNLQRTMQQPASYDDYKSADFQPSQQLGHQETHLVGKNGPIQMEAQGVEISRLTLEQESITLDWSANAIHSIYVLSGRLEFGDQIVEADDFVLVKDQEGLELKGEVGTELFRISTPAKLDYLSYREIMQQRMA